MKERTKNRIGGIVSVVVIGLIFTIYIMGLMYGWGLVPVNWWWIVGSMIGSTVLTVSYNIFLRTLL